MAKVAGPRTFHRGELWVHRHEDLRAAVSTLASRRKVTPYVFSMTAGLSNAIGAFLRDGSEARTTRMKQLLDAVTYHRFQTFIADPNGAGTIEVVDLDGLREALRKMAVARGVSADSFRKTAGNSSSMTTFMVGSKQPERQQNLQSAALFRLLEHYGAFLVFRDQLHRSAGGRPSTGL